VVLSLKADAGETNVSVLSKEIKFINGVKSAVVTYVREKDGTYNVGLAKGENPEANISDLKEVVSFKQGLLQVDDYDIAPSGRSLCLMVSRPRLGASNRVYSVIFYSLQENTGSVFRSQVIIAPSGGREKKALRFLDINDILEQHSRQNKEDVERPTVTKGSTLSGMGICYAGDARVSVTGALAAGWNFALEISLDEQAEDIQIGNVTFHRVQHTE
jgi:hypothetical protein